MSCARVRNWLDKYRDGELAAPRRRQCESHLGACASCRQAFAEQEAIASALHGWEEARAGEELAARVLAAWRARFPRQRRSLRRHRLANRLAAGAAAAATAAALGFAAIHLANLPPRSPARLPMIARGDEAWLEELFPELALEDAGTTAPSKRPKHSRSQLRGEAPRRPEITC